MKILGRRSVVHGHLSRLGSSDAVIFLIKTKRALPVYFHAKVSQFFHREVSHLQIMFLSSCWRQDISWILPFLGRSG